jgi:AcrR family transcriptional regulator
MLEFIPTGWYELEAEMTLRQQRAEETRANILKAAVECFAEHGYAGTGVNEICQRAGVTKGAFYHHFPSKQAVFLELFNRWLEGLDTQLAAARAGSASVPEGLLQMANMAEGVFDAADGQLPMFLEFWTEARHDPAIWQEMIAPYRRYRDYFSGIIQAGIAEGSLRSVDPDVAAQIVVSLAVGLVLQGVLDPKGANWGEVIREGIRILLQGLQRKQA